MRTNTCSTCDTYTCTLRQHQGILNCQRLARLQAAGEMQCIVGVRNSAAAAVKCASQSVPPQHSQRVWCWCVHSDKLPAIQQHLPWFPCWLGVIRNQLHDLNPTRLMQHDRLHCCSLQDSKRLDTV